MPVLQRVSPELRTMRNARAQEGICAACGKQVTAHVGKGGEWLGCKAVQGVRLMLVPDRREQVRTPITPAIPTSAQVAYIATAASRDKAVALASERDRGIYRLISRKSGGATRADLFRMLGGEALADSTGVIRTGIVDGALRRLRIAGLIRRIGLE